MNLSTNLRRRFSGQRPCKILYVMTLDQRRLEISHSVIYNSNPSLYLASLLVSLPLFVVSAVGEFGAGKSIPNDITIAKMAFKEGFVELFKFLCYNKLNSKTM